MGDFEDLAEKRRLGKLEATARKKRLGIPKPVSAIRQKCLDCCCGNDAEVKRCHITNCPLWVYRFGRSPRETDLAVPEYDSFGNKVGEHQYGEDD